MVRTIIEDVRPVGVFLSDLSVGYGFIYDDGYYIKTDRKDETSTVCINVQTWELSHFDPTEYVVPCKMEMLVKPGLKI